MSDEQINPTAGDSDTGTTDPQTTPSLDAPIGADGPNLETAIPGLSTVNPADLPKGEQAQRTQREPAEAKNGWWWGTGRRKRAIARVRIRPAKSGDGSVSVQVSGSKFKPYDEYFCLERDQADVLAPLKATDTLGKLDVVIRCNGGGFMGQAQACRLGIARVIRDYDPATEDTLRERGYLTRDAREVERKKYGQKGARARFQFSKR